MLNKQFDSFFNIIWNKNQVLGFQLPTYHVKSLEVITLS